MENLKRIPLYFKRHNKESLFCGCLLTAAGLSVASIGALNIINDLQAWMSSNNMGGPPFNTMMAASIAAFVLILPSILFFLVAYLLTESHSLGQKLSFALSAGCLAIAVFAQNSALALGGVLCFWAGEVDFLTKRKIPERKVDSPQVTENMAQNRLGCIRNNRNFNPRGCDFLHCNKRNELHFLEFHFWGKF